VDIIRDGFDARTRRTGVFRADWLQKNLTAQMPIINVAQTAIQALAGLSRR
jgi:hypothetical protein